MSDKEIQFEITPYKLSVQVDTDNNSGTIKTTANSKTTLTALIVGFPLGSDVVNMLFSAEDGPYKSNIENADTYTTSVRLLDSDSNATIYSITWTIDPVKFDLSGVKWLYNGQLPYDKINGSKAELDPKTLPAGLTPNVINNTGTTVGTSRKRVGNVYVRPCVCRQLYQA